MKYRHVDHDFERPVPGPANHHNYHVNDRSPLFRDLIVGLLLAVGVLSWIALFHML